MKVIFTGVLSFKDDTPGCTTYWGNTRSHFVIDERGKLADVQVKVSPTDSVSRALASIGEGE